jgi:hypothetical protein
MPKGCPLRSALDGLHNHPIGMNYFSSLNFELGGLA